MTFYANMQIVSHEIRNVNCCMKCQCLFSGENKKCMSSADIFTFNAMH